MPPPSAAKPPTPCIRRLPISATLYPLSPAAPTPDSTLQSLHNPVTALCIRDPPPAGKPPPAPACWPATTQRHTNHTTARARRLTPPVNHHRPVLTRCRIVPVHHTASLPSPCTQHPFLPTRTLAPAPPPRAGCLLFSPYPPVDRHPYHPATGERPPP